MLHCGTKFKPSDIDNGNNAGSDKGGNSEIR